MIKQKILISLIIDLLYLVVIAVLLGSVVLIQELNKSTAYEFGDFKIEEEKFNLLSEQVVGDFVLCNIKEDKCIMVRNDK